jgi:hypothetical protein
MQKKYILVFSFILLALFSACGKKGDPIPQGLPLAGGITDLSGEVKDGVFFISFTVPKNNRDGSEIKDLAGFRVFKNCGTCMGTFEPFRNISLEEQKGYTIYQGRLYIYDDDFANGYEYSYKVYPYTTKGTRGDPSNTLTVKWEKPPEPPANVSTVADDGRVELRWLKEDGYFYNVYRYDGNTYPLFPVNPERISASLFMDSGLTNHKKYTYEVRKVREIGGRFREGEGTRVETVPIDKTPPRQPEAVRAVKKGSLVSVTWKENTEKDFAGYNIYRVVRGTKEKINKDRFKENSFLDRKTPDERFVSYYVTALDEAGNESEPSQESIVILKE